MASEGRRRIECPKPRTFVDTETGELIETQCLNWGCPDCGKKRQAELALRARMGMNLLCEAYKGRGQFLTLTLDPGRNEESAANGSKRQAKYVSACWKRLRGKWGERCRRRASSPPWYLKVAEWRKFTEAMHLHVILMGWLPSSRGIRDDIVTAGFGRVFDVSPVESVERLTRYVTKYVTKSASEGAPRYVHRYSTSRGAVPPLSLWKRLILEGCLGDLKAAAEGKPWAHSEAGEVWWTGEKRMEIEAALTEREAARELARPRGKLLWVRPGRLLTEPGPLAS